MKKTIHPGDRRRSASVTFNATTAASIVGAGLLLGGCDDTRPLPPPPRAVVSSAHAYTNDDYIPGLGYYHAPYHAWFPHRYNEHDADMGYYYNGRWHSAADRSDVTTSHPDEPAALAANAALAAEERDKEDRGEQGTGPHYYHGSGGHWWGSSWGSSSSRTSSAPSTTRGGFGRFFSSGS